jgi:hypothetical protein
MSWEQVRWSTFVEPLAADEDEPPDECEHTGDEIETRPDGRRICPFDGLTAR